MASPSRTRKHRRALRRRLKNGGKEKARHKLLAGRTGGVHRKKLQSRRPITDL